MFLPSKLGSLPRAISLALLEVRQIMSSRTVNVNLFRRLAENRISDFYRSSSGGELTPYRKVTHVFLQTV